MWEALTAFATLGTGVAIVLTVLLGVRQLRLTGAHLVHLRKSTQLEGAMKIFDDLFARDCIQSMRFVTDELPSRMHDPEFRAGVASIQHADDSVHQELIVMRYFERIGTYVKNGLIDGSIIYDLMSLRIKYTWEAVGDVVRIHRAAHGQGLWENFEFLYNDTMRFIETARNRDYLK